MAGQQRVAIVTGAAYNIGLAIATRLARDGFRLGLTAEVMPDAAVAAAADAGTEALAVVADLTEPTSIEGVIAEVANRWGRLDVLVNNAGLSRSGPLETTTLADLDELLAVNLRAGCLAVRAASAIMRQQGGGSVINVSSIHSLLGMVGHSAYAATKGAVNAYTRELAVELGPFGIRVNAVLPGIIENANYFDVIPGYLTERAARNVPLGRVGCPDDVASVVSFLASDDAGFVSGSLISVDGGQSARMAIEL